MNLTCIAPAFPYRGGISTFGMRLANELSLGHECDYINFSRLYPNVFFPGKTQFVDSSEKSDFESYRILSSINPASWIKVARYLRKTNPHALIFHWWHPLFGPAYRFSSLLLSRETVKIAICHNVIPHDAGFFWKFMAETGLSHMDGIVTHGNSEREKLEQLFPDKPCLNLFHPILDVFPGETISKSTARQKLGLSEEEKIALYFGLIRPYKGVEVLLKAIPLIEEIDDFKCLIVGEIYSNEKEIRSLINKCNPNQVKLVDSFIPNDQVSLWFRVADVIVLPYISATQSGIIPIAYRCNRPVIATDVGALSDVVINGKTGYLVPAADTEELARSIVNFFKEQKTRDFTPGINEIISTHSWKVYTEKLLNFIKEIA